MSFTVKVIKQDITIYTGVTAGDADEAVANVANGLEAVTSVTTKDVYEVDPE